MDRLCTAFEGPRRIASGEFRHVAPKARRAIARGGRAPVLVFNDATGEVIDLDYREPSAAPPPEEPQSQTRGPGRPKLGVIGREVTLLPRHWDWLNRQPGGASVALRKLVEEARRVNAAKDRIRAAQEAAYRFMSVMAGDEPGFEEALRALFAGRQARFEKEIAGWPIDVRDHARKLAAPAFAKE
jgi:hypothetical protein